MPDDMLCKECGVNNFKKRGYTPDGRPRYQCKDCGKWSVEPIEGKEKEGEIYTFTDNGNTAEVTATLDIDIINSPEKLLKAMNVDTKIWEVYKKQIGKSPAWRKDRIVDWEVSGGVANGKVKDSGKIKVVPVYTVKLWLRRKVEEIRTTSILADMIEESKSFMPKYPKIKYSKKLGNMLYELAIPDLQLGRLVMAEEAGSDINPDIQISQAESVIDKLIEYSKNFDFERCLFPVGNDFFDTNSADMATKHGTPQEDDVRWKRTYKLGCSFIRRTIEKLMQIAPVDVLIIPGNHDEDKIWHLGEYIDAWFNKSKDVLVDNRMMKRKYYGFGKDLVGLTHGYFEKHNKLDSLMAYEVPQLWANSTHREWHLGDLHHKADMILKTNESNNGVVIRILRNLAPPSVWEFDKAFVGSQHSGEAFVWGKNDGVIAQFTASPRRNDK